MPPKRKPFKKPPPAKVPPKARPNSPRARGVPVPIEVVGADVGPPAPLVTRSIPAPATTAITVPVSTTPVATWVSWYNTTATPDQQTTFDRAASVIDNGGSLYAKGGTYANYVENYVNTPVYAPIVNYRDTGGRAALFATPPKVYGQTPISIAKSGGPIEKTPTGYVLHPGRYSYTATWDNVPTFSAWVSSQPKNQVVIGQTQLSPAVLPGGDPYYEDFEITILKDTPWPLSVNGAPLPGVPSWVPKGINIIDYWGQVTSSHPDWGWVPNTADELENAIKGLTILGVVIGGAYILSQLRPAPRFESRRDERD